ncbi:MAG: carboxymuconolactone decarboxylase family protein [Acidimicrobiia bacterium]
MPEEAPLLNEEADHPHEIAFENDRGRIVLMDSMRYVDARNGSDVVVASSYLGVLPARLAAPHTPRAVIGHDGCVGKDGAGIAGLGYLEALGIPAATAAGMSAELGNGPDLYEHGVISYMNILAERLGVTEGMSVRDAAQVLLNGDIADTTPGTRIRREVMESHDDRAVVVTDSIVFALPEDHGRNVLVTAGHTGRSGASFVKEVMPWGFISADGGRAKNDSGISGLQTTEELGIPGATYDVFTAPIGDACKAYADGRISALNAHAHARGVYIGQPVREAAHCLLVSEAKGGTQLTGRLHSASPVLDRGELSALAPKFAEGLARVRDVTDEDGALPAKSKALFMAAAAAVKGHTEMCARELGRAYRLGVSLVDARGASLAVLISRGEAVYERFARAIDVVFGERSPRGAQIGGQYEMTADTACEYFVSYFGHVPEYIAFMAAQAPRALEGYALMREWALAENPLGMRDVELLLCTVNAAEFAPRFIAVHAGGARRAGATDAQLAEAAICAIPVAGVAAWLPAADAIAESASQ